MMAIVGKLRGCDRTVSIPSKRNGCLAMKNGSCKITNSSIVLWACLAVVLMGLALGAEATPPGRARKIAITFDDLPAVSVPAGQTCDLEALKTNTVKLLAT